MKKKVVSFITIICMVITLIPATVATSYAATESVPTVRTTAPSKSNEYFYGPNNWYAANGWDAGPSGGNCTWYAYGRAYEYTGKVQKLSYNNACTWYDAWQGSKGKTPKAGSIICWSYAGGGDGHVAFVEKVKDNGDIFISNSGWSNIPSWNHGGDYKSAKNGNISYGWLDKGSNNWQMFSGMNFQGFIYLDGKPAAWPTVNASNVTSTGKIKLSWYSKKNASKYYVYRSTSKTGSYKLLKKTTSKSYTDSAATPGTLYYYKVKAVSKYGKSLGYSDVISRSCDLAQPKLTGISNVASHGGIKISFKGVKNANKYKLYRATSKNGPYEYLFELNCSKTHKGGEACYAVNSGGTPGTAYYYKLQAVTTKNTGADSALSAYMYRTRDLAQPELTGISNVESTGAVKVTFKGVKGADRYELYRATSKTGKYSYISKLDCDKDSGGEAHYFTSTGGTKGKTYYYKVRAVMRANSNATSALSKYMSGKVKSPSSSGGDTSATGTANANAMVSSAEASVGKSKTSLGLTGEWCARFVYYCAEKSGNASKIGNDVYVGSMAEKTVNDKGGTIIFVNKNAYNACKDRFVSARCKYDPNYIPKKGDLYIQKGEDLGDQYFAHIGIVRKNSSKSSIAYTIEGNTSCSDGKHADYKYVEYKTRNKNGFIAPYGFSAFVKPAYAETGSNMPVLKVTNDADTGKNILNWTATTKDTTFTIYRCVKGETEYTAIATGVKGKTYTDSTAVNGTCYTYKVKSDYYGTVSKAFSRSCDLARPIVTLSNNPKTGKIIVSWQDVDNADSYKIYIATSKNGTYKYTATWESPGNDGQIHNVAHNSGTAGKTYYYKVKAYNSGNSDATSVYSKYVYRTCDLAQPDVTLSYSDSGKIVLSWPNVKGADRYEIYRSTDAGTGFERIYSGTSRSVTNTKNLVSETTYYYKVRAIDKDKSAANSAYSEVKSLTYY